MTLVTKKRVFALITIISIFIILFNSELLFTNYNENFKTKKIVSNSIQINKNDTNQKYIVYQCIDGQLCGGWGDRLKGIYSAYAWALISGRRLLIHINKPCDLTYLVEPNKINWVENMTELYRNKKIDTLICIDQAYFKDQMKNNKLDFFERNETDIIIIRNNLDWLESFAVNVNIKERLISLGFVPAEFKMQFVFRKWYNELFKLNNNIETKYQEFLTKKGSSKLICAQVRIGGARPHVDHDAPFTDKKNTFIYWNYIRNNFTNNQTDYKIFLTTDTRNIEIEAQKEFGDKIIINDGINAHLDREHRLGDNCSKVYKTYLDFHSLQNCDAAIISESGFGLLGTWNRVNPNLNLVMFTKQKTLVRKNRTADLFIF